MSGEQRFPLVDDRYRAVETFVFPSSMLFTERRRIVELATKQRLPSMSQDRAFVELGGLLSYARTLPSCLGAAPRT